MKTSMLVAIVAACGLVTVNAQYGKVYGDIGNAAPYLQQLEPLEGPKQGGTPITIQGAGFINDERLTCRFSRLNPNTEMTVTKMTSATYVSSTEIVCDSPEWEEDACPTCIDSADATYVNLGSFVGHSGSRYIRSSNPSIGDKIGVGDYIQLAGAQIGTAPLKTALTQYFQIQAIERCAGVGCFCPGTGEVWQESVYTVGDAEVRYNGTGVWDSAPDRGFEIVDATRKIGGTIKNSATPETGCSMYRYDELTGGASNVRVSPSTDLYPQGATCTPECKSALGVSIAWTSGTKIILSEPVYKIDGTKNTLFTSAGYRAHKFSCTSCKCAGGCSTTVSVSNDGELFSGAGLGGQVWSGSALAFSMKDIVPTVQYIDLGLPGYRDSTRIFGPASGGTTITVHGANFQKSPLLRCYFATVKVLVKAEYVSPTKAICITPAFFSRQKDEQSTVVISDPPAIYEPPRTPSSTMGDSTTVLHSQQEGSALTPHTKVHVTNDGMLGIPETEGAEFGHISINPYLTDDGSPAYIQSFDADNTYYSGISSNPWRSTCQEGLYPNEGMKPCWSAHKGDGSQTFGRGNDVLFKYATCYDANPAEAVPSLDYYGGTIVGTKYINSTESAGQELLMKDMNYHRRAADGWTDVGSWDNTKIVNNNVERSADGSTIDANNVAGPLAHIQLHLEKDSSAEAVLEVMVSSSNFVSAGGIKLSSETIVVSKIGPATGYEYNVFFNTPTYMATGFKYYLEIKWISGAEDVKWKYVSTTTSSSNPGSMSAATIAAGTTTVGAMPAYQFRMKGFTCDGCRTKYSFDPTNQPQTDLRFGEHASTRSTNAYGESIDADQSTQWPLGHAGDQLDANSFRSMLAQEFRPSETGTLTHTYLKLKLTSDTTTNGDGVSQTMGVASNNYADRQAYVSIWITQHGKYGQYVCSVFGGLPSSVSYVCDTNHNGTFNGLCVLGAVCDPNLGLNGGCGDRGACTLAQTVTNAHTLRPELGGATGPCGLDDTCAVTESLQPDHRKYLSGNVDQWVEFEFKVPVSVEKHTTYFVNVAVVGNTDVSREVVWYSGLAWGDGGATTRLNPSTPRPPGAAATVDIPSDELRASYHRDKTSWIWKKQTNRVMAIKFTRCVSSTAQAMGFSTIGEKTGCCSARASPQGGDKGAMVTVTGRNFFPSQNLACVFRPEVSTLPSLVVPATVLDYSYTKLACPAPTHNPHYDANRDCTNPELCNGAELLVTNDGFTTGPQLMGPKWKTATISASLVPDLSVNAQISYLGQSPLKFLFSDIYVSRSGDDRVGDGTLARPYGTIQRGIDAANEYDQIVLMKGTYTGLGNRGLRHHGKKIQLRAYDMQVHVGRTRTSREYAISDLGSDNNLQNTVVDCQHAPDGFILNNNKDSDSPYAGFIDTQDIITKNCENLRIYDI